MKQQINRVSLFCYKELDKLFVESTSSNVVQKLCLEDDLTGLSYGSCNGQNFVKLWFLSEFLQIYQTFLERLLMKYF